MRRQAMADMAAGRGQGAEDIVIGALVMMPFIGALVVLLGWMMPLPNVVAMLLFVVLTVPAAFWNAGRRARG